LALAFELAWLAIGAIWLEGEIKLGCGGSSVLVSFGALGFGGQNSVGIWKWELRHWKGEIAKAADSNIVCFGYGDIH